MRSSQVTQFLSILLIAPMFAGCISQNSAPKSPPPISIWLKLNPLWWFETSKPPADYKPRFFFRRLDWFFRNPLHNFTFYVIGISDHFQDPAYHRYGTYPDNVFSPTPGWNICMIHYHWLRLPFVAYWNHRMSFYIGWRRAGEFGAKINFFHHPVNSL